MVPQRRQETGPGHRVELACPDPEEEALIAKLDAVKWDMLDERAKTRRAPRHAAFLHASELGQAS